MEISASKSGERQFAIFSRQFAITCFDLAQQIIFTFFFIFFLLRFSLFSVFTLHLVAELSHMDERMQVEASLFT